MVGFDTLKALIGSKKALVLGLGKSGVSTLDFFERIDVAYDGYDDGIDTLSFKENYSLLKTAPTDLSAYSLLIPAPGIPHTNPVIRKAKSLGIPVIGDIELFYLSNPRGKTIAITGTNGKSTTTALIHHILRENGVKTNIGGNFGIPVLDFDFTADAHVIETSSYQLDLLDKTSFDIALHLNLTPDHLDRHGDMEGYKKAKERIFKNAGKAVIGIDDRYSNDIYTALKQNRGDILTVSLLGHKADLSVENDILLFKDEKVMDLSALETLKGAHNHQNIACAFAACHFYGIPHDKIIASIKTFAGLEHRQKLVTKYENVSFVNDSKATNADATEKALKSYGNIYWIVGGRQKQGGLSGLEPYLKDIRHSFIIGEAAPAFAEWHKKNKAPFTLCDTVVKATKEATERALKDGFENAVVLLSPACASWDQYPNFEARGKDFIDAVAQTLHSYKRPSP